MAKYDHGGGCPCGLQKDCDCGNYEMRKAATQPNHGERKHSELGASICYRWWNCPGSVALIRGLPNPQTIHGATGTACHEVAQLCLESGQDAREYVGRVFHSLGFTVEITAEMAEAVQVYLDDCRTLDANAGILPSDRMVEVQFDLSSLDPPAPMYGTADFVAYNPLSETLYVRDYKNGFGHVEVEGNPQLRYYALGAMLKLGKPVREVEVTICQPNGAAAPIRRDTFSGADLIEWAAELMHRAREALKPDAPLNAGPWCSKTFCPARGKCPAQAEHALAVAQVEFPPLPHALLSPEELGALIAKLDRLAGIIGAARKDAHDAATAELQAGRDVPGWKLVEAESNRDSWRDEANAEAALQMILEIDPYEQKVVSPAKARSRLADKHRVANPKVTKKAAEAAARAQLVPLMYRRVSVSLAPATDSRPAVSGGAAEFPALPDETEES